MLITAVILLVLGLLSFSRNSEIAYRERMNGEATNKSFADTLTFSTLLIGLSYLIYHFSSHLKKHEYSNKWWYIASGIILLTAMYFDYFWKHIPIFLFIWPYFGLVALIFAAILVCEYEQAASFSKYLYLLLDVISAGLMLMFFVIASLKADAHIYRVLVSLTSHKWHDIFMLPILSVSIICARFFVMFCCDRKFGEALTHTDKALILVGLAGASVIVLPFLILVPLKLDGSIKLHFGFCIASLIVPFAAVEICLTFYGNKRGHLELRYAWMHEEGVSKHCFAVQKFEWLRMKLGLSELSKGEAVVGFGEFHKRLDWIPEEDIGSAKRDTSRFRLSKSDTEEALKMRRDYYARFEGSDCKWWESFVGKAGCFAFNLFKIVESTLFRCLLALFVVAVYLIL
ncbi:uncharacterized protein MONOS_18221 [Monocercomonoides exilis]|uniref:uncharacterized protein n=1 Tax=Monocercomonoides exilis TaxID=2049356 RepID=UPI00355A754E|nr:hypothetical protein MONOS_18221 [Monocercomonoides exilis]